MGKDITIVTTTMADPAQEYSLFRIELAKRTVKEAVKQGYEIVIADGSTEDKVNLSVPRARSINE